jgi:hypothetical protein
MGRARDLANILSSSGSVALDSEMGLTLITPSSIVVTGGSGSISSTGIVNISSASSVSLNNIFSSTYNSYSFTFNLTGSTALSFRARVRTSGTDNTSTNYLYTNWESTFASSSVTGQTSWAIGDFYDSDQKRSTHNFFIRDVQVSGRYTSGHSITTSDVNSGVYPLIRFHGLSVTTSYDGITFIAGSGTITGTISTYGYKG